LFQPVFIEWKMNRPLLFAGPVPVLALVALLMLCGCDQVSRHKALTTIFDGVPSLPPVEDLCQDYASAREFDASASEEKAAAKKGSSHRPYAEKECSLCHKSSGDNALIVPRDQLCFVCHTDFIQGTNVHGPVSVGDCLACHNPHDSSDLFLLKADRSLICSRCHVEERLAMAMHNTLKERGMACVDCHDAHAGNNRYFLD
jgi:predicted CXXCH cytochrome family protein